jgi:hypothetical protein
MPSQETRIGVARRRLQLRLDSQRARIRRERLYRCHLWSVDVAFTTEVPRVAGGARRRYGAGSRASGQTAVAFELEAWRLVRLRDGKPGHIRPGKPDRLGQRFVAGRTGAIGG